MMLAELTAAMTAMAETETVGGYTWTSIVRTDSTNRMLRT